MKRKHQTRKMPKRGSGYKPNNSWILKPIEESNIQRTTVSSILKNNLVQTIDKNSKKSVLQYTQKTNRPGNSNTITSIESVQSSIPSISPARSPLTSTNYFRLPVHSKSLEQNEIIKSQEVSPRIIESNINQFVNIPIQHKGIAPVVVGAETHKFIPETPIPKNGNYSYSENQFGPYSQNKSKNSLKTRAKRFFMGSPRNPFTKGPTARKARKTQKSRK